MVLGPTPVKRLLTEQLAVSCWSLVWVFFFTPSPFGIFSLHRLAQGWDILPFLSPPIVSEEIKEEEGKVMSPHGGHQS